MNICYHDANGKILGPPLTASNYTPAFAVANSPPTATGFIATEEHVDWLARMVDVGTGKVIDYQPPSPGANFGWNINTRRWEVTAAVRAQMAKDAAAKSLIADQESRSLRTMREAILALPVAGLLGALIPSDVRTRLKAQDDAVTAKRQDIMK